MSADTGLDRRSFLKSLSVGAVITLVPFACGKQQEKKTSKASGGQPAAQPPRTVYTRENPGPWRSKIEGHVPRATLTKLDEEGNYRVDIVVNHEMNPDKPHWIEFIQLNDQDDNVLAKKSFLATDPKAEASFTANVAHVAKFKAYDLCNVHGLWLQEYAIPA